MKNLLLTILLLSSTSAFCQESGQAVDRRVWASTTVLANGQVLVSGGSESILLSAVNRATVFSPATNSYVAAPAMPETRVYPKSALLPNGQALLVGGDCKGAICTNLLFDTKSQEWLSGPSLVTPRNYYNLLSLKNGSVFIVGGKDSGSADVDTIEVLHPGAKSFVNLGKITPVDEPSSVLFQDPIEQTERVLLLGSVGVDIPFAQIIDPVTGHSYPVKAPHSVHKGALLVDHPQAGVLPSGKILFTDNTPEIFDPANDSWSAAPALLLSRKDATVTTLQNGEILVVGGTADMGATRTAEIYNEKDNSWRPAASMHTGRFMHTATLLKDGRVLVVGGDAYYSTVSSVEVYDPKSDSWTLVDGTEFPITPAR